MKIFKWLFMALLIVISLSAKDLPGYHGVRLGQSYEDASKRILEIDPEAEITTGKASLRDNEKNTTLITFWNYNGNKIVAEIFVFIGLNQYRTMLDALYQKYGNGNMSYDRARAGLGQSWVVGDSLVFLHSGQGINSDSIMMSFTPYLKFMDDSKKAAAAAKLD
jgi:hypothetical protein